MLLYLLYSLYWRVWIIFPLAGCDTEAAIFRRRAFRIFAKQAAEIVIDKPQRCATLSLSGHSPQQNVFGVFQSRMVQVFVSRWPPFSGTGARGNLAI